MLNWHFAIYNKLGGCDMEAKFGVEIDKSQWSRSSQNSSGGHYDERATLYENIAYRCKKCSAACVFTAMEQKHAYEVEKRFVWWLPSLCEKCHSDVERLKAENHTYQERWKNEKVALENDVLFLRRWLFVLTEIPSYGKRGNWSMVTMLTERLLNMPSSKK